MAESTYKSGWCHTGRHDRCLGAYAGCACTCAHHSAPPPERPVPVAVHCFFGCPHAEQQPTPAATHDAMERHYFEAHRADIARAVGWLKA